MKVHRSWLYFHFSSRGGSGKRFPTRPGYGTLGRPVQLEINCWDLHILDIPVYVHDVMPICLESSDGKAKSKNEKAILKHMKYALKK